MNCVPLTVCITYLYDEAQSDRTRSIWNDLFLLPQIFYVNKKSHQFIFVLSTEEKNKLGIYCDQKEEIKKKRKNGFLMSQMMISEAN